MIAPMLLKQHQSFLNLQFSTFSVLVRPNFGQVCIPNKSLPKATVDETPVSKQLPLPVQLLQEESADQNLEPSSTGVTDSSKPDNGRLANDQENVIDPNTCYMKMCLQEMELCGYHAHVEDGCTKTVLKDLCQTRTIKSVIRQGPSRVLLDKDHQECYQTRTIKSVIVQSVQTIYLCTCNNIYLYANTYSYNSHMCICIMIFELCHFHTLALALWVQRLRSDYHGRENMCCLIIDIWNYMRVR